jgi:hypothetical protein
MTTESLLEEFGRIKISNCLVGNHIPALPLWPKMEVKGLGNKINYLGL